MLFYRALLFLYPSSWRAEYSKEMCAVFQSRRREARGSLWLLLVLWLETVPDLILNAFAVQRDLVSYDVRYALRALYRSPGFTMAAVAIAALGIGATTAAFTMVDLSAWRPSELQQDSCSPTAWADYWNRCWPALALGILKHLLPRQQSHS